MSAVLGEPASSGMDVAASSGEGVAPPDSSVEQGQSSAGFAEEAGQPGQVTGAPQGEEPEVDVTSLDLTQPDGLRQFRSSYEKVKWERDEEKRLRQSATQELESVRASQGKGVYLDTNLPLEDFKPREALNRMMEEEPEYYEALAADFVAQHFWADMGRQVKTIEGKPLNPNDPADMEKLENLGTVWDSLARRMSKNQLDGDTLAEVLEILEKSPHLQREIIAQLNGAAPSALPQGMPQQPQQANWGQQPQGIENAEAIATRYGLDASDEVHAQLITQIQQEQQMRLVDQTQRARERQQYDLQIQAMQQQLYKLQNDQEGLRNTSSEEAQRRASARLTELLDTSLDTDIRSRYENAVPKDRPGLLGDLRTIAQAALDKNPDYQTATSRAEKWFRQAAGAKDGRDRDRWDRAGLDALTVVSNYRAKAIADAATRLLGPVHRTAAKQEQKTRDLQRGRREIPGGQATPPINQRQPVETGNIQAARDSVRQRLRDAINQGVPGLPRV